MIDGINQLPAPLFLPKGQYWLEGLDKRGYRLEKSTGGLRQFTEQASRSCSPPYFLCDIQHICLPQAFESVGVRIQKQNQNPYYFTAVRMLSILNPCSSIIDI